MIRTLRAFFLNRVLREKMLLVGFLGIAAVMWATAYSSRASRMWRSIRTTTTELRQQEALLARRGEIEAATLEAASKMDPSKTLDPTGLTVEVDRMANEAKVNVSRGSVVQDASSGQFAMNSIRLNVIGAEWGPFIEFYRKLQTRAPYLTITELAINPVPRNPAQVSAVMNVVSFEVKRGASPRTASR